MRIRIGLGERWAIVAAICYTLVNVTLRAAAPHIDPFLGSMLRQLPVALLAWGVVLATGRREFAPRSPAFLGWRFIGALLAGGFMSFFIGNVFFFGALADGGLGITVNSVQAGSVFAGIALAVLLLHEWPRREQIAGAVIIAIGLAFVAFAQLGTPSSRWYVGLILAALAGSCYAVSNVMTRLVQRARPILFVTLAGTSLGGFGALFVAVLYRAGFDPVRAFASLDTPTLAAVLLAGVANALALIGLTQAMKYTDVATTNTLSSSQIVFSFLASVLFFQETGSLPMVVGVVLVVAGIVVAQMDRSRRRADAAAGLGQAPAGPDQSAAASPAAAAPLSGDTAPTRSRWSGDVIRRK